MTNTDVVRKLIGSIEPVGETNTDAKRGDNLKEMCELVGNLVQDIKDVVYTNKHAHEHSIKVMVDYANSFLTDTLGMKEVE